MMMGPLEKLRNLRAWVSVIMAPEPDVPVWQWGEQNIQLTQLESSEMPGPLDTSVTPYMREPLESFRDPTVKSDVWVTGTQAMKTITILVGTAWWLANRVGQALWVRDTRDNARSFVKRRWKPMLDNCPALRVLRPTDADLYTNLEQQIGASVLSHVGSNSSGNLSERPVDLAVLDEVDKYPQESREEGSAVDQVRQRGKARSLAKMIMASTPTTADGLIWSEYLAGDMRLYHVPCPHCAELIALEWKHVKWDAEARTGKDRWDYDRVKRSAFYECQACAGRITDAHKPAMLLGGKWIASNPHAPAGHRSRRLPSWYAPWQSCRFGELAVTFLEFKRKKSLKSWINYYCGEPTEEEADGVDAELLMTRRTAFRGERPYMRSGYVQDAPAAMPDGVLVITGFADVQADRLEAGLIGWGLGEESWTLEHQVFQGDPTKPRCWEQLDAWLLADRALPVRSFGVDTGHEPDEVHKFVMARHARGVFATKGYSVGGKPVVNQWAKHGRLKCPVMMVGADTAKVNVFHRLRTTEHGAGYCHFPDVLPDGWFYGLCSEVLKTSFLRGRMKKEWVKIHERNEPLDIAVGALVALRMMGPTVLSKADREARAEAEDAQDKPARKPRGGGYVGKFRK